VAVAVAVAEEEEAAAVVEAEEVAGAVSPVVVEVAEAAASRVVVEVVAEVVDSPARGRPAAEASPRGEARGAPLPVAARQAAWIVAPLVLNGQARREAARLECPIDPVRRVKRRGPRIARPA
jgi:hypothetical protein